MFSKFWPLGAGFLYFWPDNQFHHQIPVFGPLETSRSQTWSLQKKTKTQKKKQRREKQMYHRNKNAEKQAETITVCSSIRSFLCFLFYFRYVKNDAWVRWFWPSWFLHLSSFYGQINFPVALPFRAFSKHDRAENKKEEREVATIKDKLTNT